MPGSDVLCRRQALMKKPLPLFVGAVEACCCKSTHLKHPVVGDGQGMGDTILKAAVANRCGIKGHNFVLGAVFFNQKSKDNDAAAKRCLCCFYAAKRKFNAFCGGLFLIDVNVKVYQLYLKGVFVLLSALETIFKRASYFFWGNRSYFHIAIVFDVPRRRSGLWALYTVRTGALLLLEQDNNHFSQRIVLVEHTHHVRIIELRYILFGNIENRMPSTVADGQLNKKRANSCRSKSSLRQWPENVHIFGNPEQIASALSFRPIGDGASFFSCHAGAL